MAVLDCDLLKSTKTDLFDARFPKAFFQGGIAEHHTAVLERALFRWRESGPCGASSGCSGSPSPTTSSV